MPALSIPLPRIVARALPALAWIGVTLVALCSAGSAQTCIKVGDGMADSGPSGLRPFGSVSTSDAQHAAQTLLVYVPKSLFGGKKQRIRSIAFAPVSSRTRVMTEVFIGLRQTDKLETELVPNFGANSSGFGAGFGFRDVEWPTAANTWWHFPVDYTVSPTRSLVVQIRTRASGSTGSGDAGFRQDPSLYSVHAPMWSTPTGTVGRGGPKMLLCLDTGFAHTFADSSCVGSNNLEPRLDLSGSSRIGQSFSVSVRDAAANPGLAILAISLRGYTHGADLRMGGAPGCVLRLLSLDFLLPIPTPGGQATVPLALPNDANAIGATLGFQFFPYDPGANALKLTSSNWALMQVGM